MFVHFHTELQRKSYKKVGQINQMVNQNICQSLLNNIYVFNREKKMFFFNFSLTEIFSLTLKINCLMKIDLIFFVPFKHIKFIFLLHFTFRWIGNSIEISLIKVQRKEKMRFRKSQMHKIAIYDKSCTSTSSISALLN